MFLLCAVHIKSTHSNQIRFDIFPLGQQFPSQLRSTEGLKNILSFIAIFIQRGLHAFHRLIVGVGIDDDFLFSFISLRSCHSKGGDSACHDSHNHKTGQSSFQFADWFCQGGAGTFLGASGQRTEHRLSSQVGKKY